MFLLHMKGRRLISCRGRLLISAASCISDMNCPVLRGYKRRFFSSVVAPQPIDELKNQFFDRKFYLKGNDQFVLRENPSYDYSDFSADELESFKLYGETILNESNRLDEMTQVELDEFIEMFDKVFKKSDGKVNCEIRYLPFGKELTELEYRARRMKLSNFINEKVDLTIHKSTPNTYQLHAEEIDKMDEYSKYSMYYMNLLMKEPSFDDPYISREKLINFVNMVVANPDFYLVHNTMLLDNVDSWLLPLYERIKKKWVEQHGMTESEFDTITDPQTNQEITLSNTLFIIIAVCNVKNYQLFEEIVEECMRRDPNNVYIPFLAAYSYYLKVLESHIECNQSEVHQHRKDNHFEWCSNGIEHCKKGLDIFNSIPTSSLPSHNPKLTYQPDELLDNCPIVNRPDLKLFPLNFSYMLSVLHSEMSDLIDSDPNLKQYHVSQALKHSQRNTYVRGLPNNFLSSYGMALYAKGDLEKSIQVIEKLRLTTCKK